MVFLPGVEKFFKFKRVIGYLTGFLSPGNQTPSIFYFLAKCSWLFEVTNFSSDMYSTFPHWKLGIRYDKSFPICFFRVT